LIRAVNIGKLLKFLVSLLSCFYYRDGTTDVTRTVVLGKALDKVKKMNTLVLKGHIGNAMQIFPDNTNGELKFYKDLQIIIRFLATRIDSLARKAMWELGYDFAHGVGHGVGE
jgi:Xaa-Pro aminopeptidase